MLTIVDTARVRTLSFGKVSAVRIYFTIDIGYSSVVVKIIRVYMFRVAIH